MSDCPTRARSGGYSLVELMIAMTLGLVVLAGLGSIFTHGSRNNAQDISISMMLDELSYVMAQLNRDLEMAGFWARVHDPAAIRRHEGLSVESDCGPAGEDWVFDDLNALSVVDNASPTAAAAAHRCLAGIGIRAGSDIIAIKRVQGRVAGTDADLSNLAAGAVYLRTQGNAGTLYLHGAGPPAGVPAPYENWAFEPAIYYIQDYLLSPDESPRVPALCRMALRSSGGARPAFVRECLAQGVEDLQLEVGVDTDDDGVANYFDSSPTAGVLRRAVSVRLYLLVRSSRPDVHYRNEKTYLVGNAPPFTPSGAEARYYRKTLSTEVMLRNPRSLQGVAFK